MIGDQADGLRRLFGAEGHPPENAAPQRSSQEVRYTTVAVAARTDDVTRAYAMIKRMVREHGKRHGFRIVVTHARSHEEARAVFENMRRVAHEHLGVRLDYLSAIMEPAAKDSVL